MNIMMWVLMVLTVLTVPMVLTVLWRPTQQTGGSRAAIFSRFNYTPDFPMMSQFDTVDLDRFSKTYNTADPIRFISGRPYRFYHTKDSTWLYPWHFPQEIDDQTIQRASRICREPITLVKKVEEDKMGGLAILTPKDVVKVSPCFEREVLRT
jgi:hypothetical protein